MLSRTHIGRRVPQFLCAQGLLAVALILLSPGVLGAQSGGRPRAARDLGIRWVEVEAGTFVMGSGRAAHRVAVGRFLMSATEVTFDQFDAYCEATGKQKPDDGGWGRGARPVHHVSYDEAVGFCQWLGRETGRAVRLPSEAEWEYAARGGSRSRGYAYSGSNRKDEVSWNEGNSGSRPHPVGTKKANELGLHDMSGNLWEWCADGSAITPARAGVVERAVRGNSFDNHGGDSDLRLSLRLDRDSRHANIGFRIARSK